MVIFVKNKVVALIAAILLFGCSEVPVAQQTPTFLAPTLTSTVIANAVPSSVPTIVPSLSLESQYLPLLPEKPSGFEWKFVDAVRMAVLIPDGWFFKEEKRFLPIYEGFYVTKENLDIAGRFSTGFTVFMFSEFESFEEADKYAMNLQTTHINLETTKNVIDAWDTKTDLTTIHHLRIEGEFAYETDESQHKIIHYGTFAYKDRAYLWIIESPASTWEQEFNDFLGVMFDRSVWIP